MGCVHLDNRGQKTQGSVYRFEHLRSKLVVPAYLENLLDSVAASMQKHYKTNEIICEGQTRPMSMLAAGQKWFSEVGM